MSRVKLQVLAVVLVLVPSLAVAGDEQALADVLRKLAALERVDGSALGYAGSPGPFFLLSRTLLEQGDAEVFEKLAADGRPVTRAMGL